MVDFNAPVALSNTVPHSWLNTNKQKQKYTIEMFHYYTISHCVTLTLSTAKMPHVDINIVPNKNATGTFPM